MWKYVRVLGLLLGLVFCLVIRPDIIYSAVPNEFVEGTIANADDVNENFDYFENKFSNTGGHDHDGTDSKAITSLGTISTLTVQTTATLNGAINLNNDVTATGDLVINGTLNATQSVTTLSETNIQNLTASKPVYTSATNDLVSANVVLSTDVTGTLGAANGGTGIDGTGFSFGGKVVTYTGNATNPRNIAHGLGRTPIFIMILDNTAASVASYTVFWASGHTNGRYGDGTYDANSIISSGIDATNFQVGSGANTDAHPYVVFVQ